MVTTERSKIADEEADVRWGAPALRNLETWLMSHALEEGQAAFAVESVWVFSSYYLFPTIHHIAPVGIAARSEPGPQKPLSVKLYVPAAHVTASEQEQLSGLFQHEIKQAVGPRPEMRLTFVRDDVPEQFDLAVHRIAEREGYEYVGVFHDDLGAELGTIMRQTGVTAWLATPNTMLAGRAPAEVLGTREDRPIRDLILAVRHGLAG